MTDAGHRNLETVRRVLPGEDREVFLVEAAHARNLGMETNPLGREYVLVLWGDSGACDGVEHLADLARRFLSTGAVAAVCGGTCGEVAHDIFDEVIVESEVTDSEDNRRFPEYIYEAMHTSWHHEDGIREVVWEAIHVAYVPDRFEKTDVPVLVVVLSDDHARIADEVLCSCLPE